MQVLGDKKTYKNINNFECNFCQFSCSQTGDWKRHIVRPKHIRLTQGDEAVTQKTLKYICDVCSLVNHYIYSPP
jgi:hypothetical protein